MIHNSAMTKLLPAGLLLFAMNGGLLAQTDPILPTEARVRGELTAKAQTESGGILRIVSLKKTDGIRREVNGTPTYELEFEMQVEVKEDLKWVAATGGSFGQTANFTGFAIANTKAQSESKGGYWAGFLNQTQVNGPEYRKGTNIWLQGVATYERSERGWRPAREFVFQPVRDTRVAADERVQVGNQQSVQEAAPAQSGAQVKFGDFVKVAELDSEPHVKERSELVIPEMAKSKPHNSGVIIVLANIDERGVVTEATLMRGIDNDMGINQAAVEAAKKTKFTPGIKNGVPVKTAKLLAYKIAGQ